MSDYTTDFVWHDYDPITMGYVENWLDEHAVKSTGLDEGFRAFMNTGLRKMDLLSGKISGAKSLLKTITPRLLLPFVGTNRK